MNNPRGKMMSNRGASTKKSRRDFIARHFLYATNMFDNPAEIKANPEHRLVVAAYKAADAIIAAEGDRTEQSKTEDLS